MKVPRRKLWSVPCCRGFSSTSYRLEIRPLSELPDRIHPSYHETKGNDLLSLQWPSPPRNILLVRKENAPKATEAVLEFAKHVHTTYPNISLVLEPPDAIALHTSLPFPVYTTPPPSTPFQSALPPKVDLTTTFGGDGTILHASSLFATSASVPPILSFSLGTLGFLSEWKFPEHKRAFRELYMSGSSSSRSSILSPSPLSIQNAPGWDPSLGASHGAARTARILLRNRLRIALTSAEGTPLTPPSLHALNEVILHRGASPHLTQITISISGRILTEAVADGLIISTPTGSTAYSLSAGGSIVHPLVKGIVVTPICPRSLSFRPLVLPGEATVGLKLADGGRGKGCEVSIDGVRREGLGRGMEARVWGESVGRARNVGADGDENTWVGGVPCVMRGVGDGAGDEGWVGGLNGLLKFNYPFGEES